MEEGIGLIPYWRVAMCEDDKVILAQVGPYWLVETSNTEDYFETEADARTHFDTLADHSFAESLIA